MNTDDPWKAPPDWVPLPELHDWLAWRFDIPDAALFVPHIIRGVRSFDLRYRVAGVSFERLPTWLSMANSYGDYLVIVQDWDTANVDWRSGTVIGSGERRHPIEISWGRAEVWAKEVARTLHRRIEAGPVAPAGGAKGARRGPSSTKTQAIAEKMASDFAGKAEVLGSDTLDNLANHYKASRDTVKKAREITLQTLAKQPRNPRETSNKNR